MARLGNLGKLIAVAGAGVGGYMKGKQQLADDEERELKLDKLRRERELSESLRKAETIDPTQAASGEDALAGAQTAHANALTAAGEDASLIKQVNEDYAPTMEALEAQRAKPAGYEMNGKQFAEKPTQEAVEAERGAARLTALKAHDPERAMAYEANSLKLKDSKREDTFKAGLPALMESSRFSARKAAGEKYSIADSLADQAAFIDYGIKQGKPDQDKLMALAATMDKVEKEGYHKALSLAESGAPLERVAEEFNKSGEIKFDPAMVISDRAGTIKLRGQEVQTRIIEFKDASGKVHTINTASELSGLGEAKEILDTHFKGIKANADAEESGAKADYYRGHGRGGKGGGDITKQEKWDVEKRSKFVKSVGGILSFTDPNALGSKPAVNRDGEQLVNSLISQGYDEDFIRDRMYALRSKHDTPEAFSKAAQEVLGKLAKGAPKPAAPKAEAPTAEPRKEGDKPAKTDTKPATAKSTEKVGSANNPEPKAIAELKRKGAEAQQKTERADKLEEEISTLEKTASGMSEGRRQDYLRSRGYFEKTKDLESLRK